MQNFQLISTADDAARASRVVGVLDKVIGRAWNLATRSGVIEAHVDITTSHPRKTNLTFKLKWSPLFHLHPEVGLIHPEGNFNLSFSMPWTYRQL